jgi:hypothetical protein
MYYSLFRGKQFELLALRELASRIVSHGGIVPIIEPVKSNSTTRLSLDRFAENNLRFILITNPKVGRLNSEIVYDQLIEPSLSEYDNYLPAFYVDQSTRRGSVEAFLTRFGDLSHVLIYVAEPRDSDLLEMLPMITTVSRHIFNENRTPTQFRDRFAPESRVLLNDCFERRDRNADYPDDEFFTDRNVGEQGGTFADYSVVGSDYSDTGGPAYAVALHHVYYRDGLGSALHIRHFVSKRTATPVDPGGKFLEALEKLVAALPELGDDNMTGTCNEYIQLLERQEFPGLGYAKKLAIKHHLELVMKVG